MKTTHPSRRSAEGQCGKILSALQRAEGKWVSLITLWRLSGSMAVHSRIADLRNDGHRIEQHSEHVRGKVHSSYRLVITPEPQKP